MAKIKTTIKNPDFSKWEKAINDLTLKTGFKVEEIAKETAPVDSGNYRSQINYDGANTITANANYSAFIEYGTQAHGPKNAKALRWTKNGKVYFAKRVKGTKPKPVMRNAAYETQKQIPQIWQEAQRDNGL